MKNIKIKNFISSLEYALVTLFTMVYIEENMSRKLGLEKVGESIALMLLDKCFNYFNCAKKVAV